MENNSMNIGFIMHAGALPQRPRVDETDRRLLAAIRHGLPLAPRPFAEVGARLELTEEEVIGRLARLKQSGVIRRFGVVVRHHELGYSANAMVVWDVPDRQVAELGRCLAGFDFITLCYRRPRRLPQWRYNLYCMIHGKSREEVLAHLEWMVNHCGLQALPHEVLFSRRRFKQRGAVCGAADASREQGPREAGMRPSRVGRGAGKD